MSMMMKAMVLAVVEQTYWAYQFVPGSYSHSAFNAMLVAENGNNTWPAAGSQKPGRDTAH
jgi:hypothetical protein